MRVFKTARLSLPAAVIVVLGIWAAEEARAVSFVKTDTLTLRGSISVSFDGAGATAIITTKVDPARGFKISILGEGETLTEAWERGADATSFDVAGDKNANDFPSFHDEAGASITPVDTSLFLCWQYLDRPRPQAIYAQYKDQVIKVTPEQTFEVDFFDYDHLLHRALIRSSLMDEYHTLAWYCSDLESRQVRYISLPVPEDPTGHVDFHIPQHFWMVPGEDMLLFLLRRYVWEDDLVYRVAICDLEGNILGALPMPEYRDNAEDLRIFTSERMIVLHAIGRELHVFVKSPRDAQPAGRPFVFLKPNEDMQKAARDCSGDMIRMVSSLARHPERCTEICPDSSAVDLVKLPLEPLKPATGKNGKTCFISRYEITNAQFAAAVNWAVKNSRIPAIEREGGPTDWGPVWAFDPFIQLPVVDGELRLRIRDGQSAAHLPVLTDDYGAAVFCNALSEMEGRPTCYAIDHADETAELVAPDSGGYRLPTVEEWRAAAGVARGEEPGAAAPWLGDVRERGRRCNCDDNNPLAFRLLPYLTPVGFYNGSSADRIATISPSGCFDMFGNASELCHIDAQTGPLSLTALGGAWDDRETLERKPCGEDGFRIVRCGDQ